LNNCGLNEEKMDFLKDLKDLELLDISNNFDLNIGEKWVN
jgi:hypothetical protein